MRYLVRLTAGTFLIGTLLLNVDTWACPLVRDQFLDLDCNKKETVVGLGDSITHGLKDKGTFLVNGEEVSKNNQGGYPVRLREVYINSNEDFRIVEDGDPGASCYRVFKNLRSDFEKNKGGVHYTDYMVLLCGVNNYWLQEPPSKTIATIRKIVRYGKKKGMKVYVGDLTPVNPAVRPFQVGWVNALNSLLHSGKISSVVFNDMPLSGLNKDGIHPNPKGYNFMFKRVQTHLEKTFGNVKKHASILKQLGLNKDSDGDLLPDKIEVQRYGSNPFSSDSDQDGLSDYDEVAVYGTDPSSPDSDGDLLSDGYEIFDSKTDPEKDDTDKDGLQDGKEVLLYKTDPLKSDSDGDGVSDFIEITVNFTDALDSLSS